MRSPVERSMMPAAMALVGEPTSVPRPPIEAEKAIPMASAPAKPAVSSSFTPAARSTATASLVGQWAGFDRDSALRYVERIPTPAERDAALVSVIQAHHGDVDFAGRMFDRLTVPEQRAVAARLLYFSLRESDPQRAERYREIAESEAAFGFRR